MKRKLCVDADFILVVGTLVRLKEIFDFVVVLLVVDVNVDADVDVRDVSLCERMNKHHHRSIYSKMKKSQYLVRYD